MKFALVVTNLRGGGAEKAMLKLAALLARRGHEAHLVLLEHFVEHVVPADVNLSALSKPGQVVSKGILGKCLLAMRLRHHIAELAKSHPFDLILSTLPFADEVCKLARLPRLWHRIANTLSAEISKISLRSNRKAARRLKKYQHTYRNSKLIAVSEGVASDLRQVGIAAKRIEGIYNPFDAETIRRKAAAPTELPATPYIIHVGRFSPQKRHDLLLDAFRNMLTSHKLILLCHYEPVLEAMITDRGLEERVIIEGFKTNPYPWIAGADLLVLCSDHEGMPNVLVEALMLGTPVVSTDCPSGPRELLSKGTNAYLVPCGNREALADAINLALSKTRLPMDFDSMPFLPNTVAQRFEQLAAEAY